MKGSMNMKRYLLVLLIVVFVVPAAVAQDASPCEGRLGDLSASYQEYFSAMNAAAEAGDIPAYLDAMHDMRIALNMIDAYCRGMSFSSEDDGMQPVIGPVIMVQDGMYRATFTTDSYGSVEIETMQGDCEAGMSGLMFNAFEGQASGGAQEILQASNCIMLLKVSNTFEPWTLTFELLSPAD